MPTKLAWPKRMRWLFDERWIWKDAFIIVTIPLLPNLYQLVIGINGSGPVRAVIVSIYTYVGIFSYRWLWRHTFDSYDNAMHQPFGADAAFKGWKE